MIDTYESFKDEFDKFQLENHQLFVIHKSVESVDRKVDTNTAKFKPELKWESIHYICKNGGNPRLAGDGHSRPNQR